MSAANWFIAIGLFACAAAGGGIAYRKVEAVQPPKIDLSCPAQQAPVVNVAAPPAIVTVEAPAVKTADRIVNEGTVAKAKVKPKKRKPPTAAQKLKKNWVLQ